MGTHATSSPKKRIFLWQESSSERREAVLEELDVELWRGVVGAEVVEEESRSATAPRAGDRSIPVIAFVMLAVVLSDTSFQWHDPLTNVADCATLFYHRSRRIVASPRMIALISKTESHSSAIVAHFRRVSLLRRFEVKESTCSAKFQIFGKHQQRSKSNHCMMLLWDSGRFRSIINFQLTYLCHAIFPCTQKKDLF